MATKTISITEEAYERLANKKEKNDSFSDVIIKITTTTPLSSLIGILSKEKAAELRASIKEIRKRIRQRVDKTALQLQQ